MMMAAEGHDACVYHFLNSAHIITIDGPGLIPHHDEWKQFEQQLTLMGAESLPYSSNLLPKHTSWQYICIQQHTPLINVLGM